jgi:hypothetical protein
MGTSADFFITQSIIKKQKKILLRSGIIAEFKLGGVSSGISSIMDYKKSLTQLGYSKMTVTFCTFIKFLSYVRYAA